MISAPSPTPLKFSTCSNSTPSYSQFHRRPSSHGHEGDEGLGVICGDLQRVLAGQQQGRAARHLARPAFRCAPRRRTAWVFKICMHHGAAVREIRTDARGALRAEDRAQDAQHAPHAARLAQALFHDIAQAERLAEIHQGVAAIEHTLKNLRNRPTKIQSSANHRRHQLTSLCGARPQNIATGTRSTSNCGYAVAAAISCTR